MNGCRCVALRSTCRFLRVDGCTFYDNGGSGLHWDADPTGLTQTITGSAFVANGAYGIDEANAANMEQALSVSDCYFHNNTSGQIHGGSISGDSNGNINGDPLFSDAAGNDFRLQSSSPLLQGRRKCGNIGAFGLASAGGVMTFNPFRSVVYGGAA